MRELRWFDKNLRVAQYNLQMRDTPLMDPEKIAQQTEAMGANAMVINASDSVVWFRTETPYRKVNPYLPKDRDLLREMIGAAHRHGIKVFARGGGLSVFEEETYYQRPEWAMRGPDGKAVLRGPERPGGWHNLYVACPNGGFSRENNLEIAKEVFTKYDFDGAFWLNGGASTTPCYCGRCRKLFYDKYGYDMPEDPAKVPAGWDADIAQANSEHFARELTKVRPGLPIIRYYWGYTVKGKINGHQIPASNVDDCARQGSLICTEAQDVLSDGASSLPEWAAPTMRMKMGRTVDNYAPPVAFMHPCPGMDWRHANMPTAEYEFYCSQIPAAGGTYVTAFTGFPDTITDKRMIECVTRIDHNIMKLGEHMEAAQEDVKVLLLNDNGDSVQGWGEALIEAHIDFKVYADYQVTYERLKKYPVVIVPEEFKYTAEIAELLARYAQEGGHLIIEGTDGAKLRPVIDLLGVETELTRTEPLTNTYLRIEPEAKILQDLIGDVDIVPLHGRIGIAHPKKDTRSLMTWVPPFSDVANAGAPPERASMPAKKTDISLVSVSEHGKGSVMYIAYQAGMLIRKYAIEDMYTAIEGYVKYMLAEAQEIFIDAPKRVITTAFSKNNEQMIHFVNGIGQRPLQENIPVYDMHIRVKLGEKQVENVVSQIAGIEIPWEVKDEGAGRELHITVPSLKVWDMILITYKA